MFMLFHSSFFTFCQSTLAPLMMTFRFSNISSDLAPVTLLFTTSMLCTLTLTTSLSILPPWIEVRGVWIQPRELTKLDVLSMASSTQRLPSLPLPT